MNLFGQGSIGLTVMMALISVIPILVCITIHELAHGLAAYALGDDTAKRMGRLSLNPLRHIDPMGFLMLLVLRFGWARPVPVDMRNFRRPKIGMAIAALAGPVSNFALAFLILLFQIPLLRWRYLGGAWEFASNVIVTTAVISVYLGVFNLLPIPPLDGSKIVFAVLPDKQHDWLMRYERYGMVLLFVLILLGFTTGALREVMDGVLLWIETVTRGPSVWLFA